MARTNAVNPSSILNNLSVVIGEQPLDVEDRTTFKTDFYVTDLCGKQHLVCKEKIETVRKSMEYWKYKQQTPRGKKFYTNMKYLYQQILLFMEGNRATYEM